MSMMQDFATNVEAVLLSLGWTEVATDIEKMTVRAIFSAPGAAEQELVLKAGGYKKALAEFGGPELYPVVEEYDAPNPVVEEILDGEGGVITVVDGRALTSDDLELLHAEQIVARYPPVTQAALKAAVAECEIELAKKEVSVTEHMQADPRTGEYIGAGTTTEEPAHLERLEMGCIVPDGDEPVVDAPTGNPSNRGLIEQVVHDVANFLPHDVELAAAAIRDIEDAVAQLGQPLVSDALDRVVENSQKEDPMDRNDLALMSMKNLNKMASRLAIKGHSKLNKMALIEAIAGAMDLPSTLPVQSEPERETVKEQMAAANTEMLDRPVPPVEDGLPDLGDFVEVAVLKGAHKIRVGQSVHLVSTEDGRIAIKGVRFELKCVLNEKEMRFSNRTIVPAKWDNWLVRAIFAR